MIRFQRLNFIACLVVTASLVLARVLHYSATDLPPTLGRILGHGIHLGIWTSIVAQLLLVVLPIVVITALLVGPILIFGPD